jgi:hypothetical protein
VRQNALKHDSLTHFVRSDSWKLQAEKQTFQRNVASLRRSVVLGSVHACVWDDLSFDVDEYDFLEGAEDHEEDHVQRRQMMMMLDVSNTSLTETVDAESSAIDLRLTMQVIYVRMYVLCVCMYLLRLTVNLILVFRLFTFILILAISCDGQVKGASANGACCNEPVIEPLTVNMSVTVSRMSNTQAMTINVPERLEMSCAPDHIRRMSDALEKIKIHSRILERYAAGHVRVLLEEQIPLSAKMANLLVEILF